MTRKFSRNYSLSVVVPFVAVLILLIAVVVLAQTSGAGQPSVKANEVVAPAGTSAVAQAERPLTPWTGAGSSPVSRSHTKRHGARPMDLIPPLFMPAVDYSSGGCEPKSIAVGDVNGDGKPDLVVANPLGWPYCGSGSPWVGVLLGNGDGTFQPVATYGTGTGGYATSVAAADVNGDGKLDLVVSNTAAGGPNYDGSVGVLLGNGDGTFQPAVDFDSGGYSYASSLAVADLNGDDKPDVVVTNLSADTWGC
jgi:hypothetical protein